MGFFISYFASFNFKLDGFCKNENKNNGFLLEMNFK